MFQLEQVSSVEPYQVSQGCISMLALQKCAHNVSQELTTWVCNVSETEAIHVSYCIAHITSLIIEFIDSDVVAQVIPMLRD